MGGFGFTGLTVSSEGKLLQTYTEGGTCNTTDLVDADGKLINQTTIGGAASVSLDYFLKPEETWTNTASAGQTGSSVVTASTLNATNGGYQRVTETRRTLPDYVAPTSSGGAT